MFKFKGISSTDMGVIVKGENFLGKAPMRTSAINISGKNGANIVELGFDNYTSSLSEVVLMKNNRDEVVAWLSGQGVLEFEGKRTNAMFYDAYEVQRFHRTFNIPFLRSPFWYKIEDDFVEITNDFIENKGNVESAPIIKLTKKLNPMIEIMINSVHLKYNFHHEDFVIIDCEEKDALHNGFIRNKNLEIGFEFPVLKPGKNQISIINGDAKIEIMRKDCWL